ncbi:hypothetical protein ACJU26_09635 [Acidithiobacillus sp. M4-SHS-6]|uniref:hypothetical protein n=1 Tax=Acidithiobacillus sp. M4-SHS-6 TaxID=3383024 RepID=UPI0039BE8402
MKQALAVNVLDKCVVPCPNRNLEVVITPLGRGILPRNRVQKGDLVVYIPNGARLSYSVLRHLGFDVISDVVGNDDIVRLRNVYGSFVDGVVSDYPCESMSVGEDCQQMLGLQWVS